MTPPAHDDPRVWRDPHKLDLVIQMEPVRSVLVITPNLTVHGHKPPPHWWWRLWQYLLLGWRWQRP